MKTGKLLMKERVGEHCGVKGEKDDRRGKTVRKRDKWVRKRRGGRWEPTPKGEQKMEGGMEEGEGKKSLGGSGNDPTKEVRPGEGKPMQVKRSGGGNLTMTHRADPRGERFRIQSKGERGLEEKWEARFSCKRYGHKEAGAKAREYFWGALGGNLGETVEEKGDYDYLEEVLGGASWKAGRMEADAVEDVGSEATERVSKLIQWDRV